MTKAEAAEKVISDVGKQLGALKSCPNKSLLVKLLKQAASAFDELDQLSSLKSAVKPLSDSLVKHSLLHHRDKDIRLLVAICFSDIIRVLAPNPDFTNAVLEDIFKLFLSLFMELADSSEAYFPKRLKVLETVAKLKFCVLMLDIGAEDLVVKMFNTFFTIVSESHQESLFSAISSIMEAILKEKVSQPLIDVIFRNLLKEGKDTSPAAYQLAIFVVKYCAIEIERYVCEFLTSCIVNKDAVRSEVKEYYHEIIFEIFKCAPQLLLGVIPNLTQELLADQVDVRIKSVKLIGKLLGQPGNHVAQDYHHIFIEFLKRFSDKSAEVRLSAISSIKDFYENNPMGRESPEVLTALETRLLDFDDRVRKKAVIVACGLARTHLNSVPPQLISRTTERLRDKQISVRKTALQKLLKVYQDYCMKCSGNIIPPWECFEQIPCRILMLCYDKDCEEFRPQNMELVLAEELFPVFLSIEDRTRQWIRLFSHFNSPHLKVLNTILSQKQRLQTEMNAFLALRKNKEDIASEEFEQRVKNSVSKMSAFFPDSGKAEESFHQLNLLEDDSIFTMLAQLLDEVNMESAKTTRDNLLGKIGEKHPLFGFLQSLSTKCSFNIFSSDHVHCILDHLLNGKFGSEIPKDSTVQLLLAIVNAFPSTLRGSEEKFQLLLLKGPFDEELIQMLGKAAPYIQIELSDIYPSLERVCLGGTRSQAKLAVSAIAALSDTPGQLILTKLCKNLMDALHGGNNIPTVLQSLGTLAQHSVSTFENHDGEISQYIIDKFFLSTSVEMPNFIDSSNGTSEDNVPCKWKIFGLKALVKSFLPHRSIHIKRDINQLLDVLLQMLQKEYVSDGTYLSESDKADIRLAAAKSVLRLSRRWDLHIGPHIFHSTVLTAKDSSSSVRRQFIDKIHKLLKQHILPCKYACAFALAASDSLKDLQVDSMKYMREFIREYSGVARICQTSVKQLGITTNPAYIVVFLIHLLAHDSGFPPANCEDEEIYAQFLRPLVFTLQALLDASFVGGDVDTVNTTISCLRGIFLAIKKTEDAVDAHITPKLHFLAEFGICTLNALKHSTTSASQILAPILLPSSFYRTCPAEKREEANLSNANWSHFNVKMVQRMFPTFEPHISPPYSMLIKNGNQCKGGFQSDLIKCNRSELQVCKNDDLLMNDIRKQNVSSTTHGKRKHEIVKQKVHTGGRKKRTSFPSLPGSVELHNEFNIYDEQKKFASGNSELLIEREPFPSSCDSAATKHSAAGDGDLKGYSSLTLNDEVTKFNCISAESSKFTRLAGLGSLKDAGRKSQDLVGQRKKLWAPADKCKKTFVDSSPDAICHQEIFLDKRQGKLMKRRILLPGKENKVEKVSADTSVSRIVNVDVEPIGQRTRRRK